MWQGWKINTGDQMHRETSLPPIKSSCDLHLIRRKGKPEASKFLFFFRFYSGIRFCGVWGFFFFSLVFNFFFALTLFIKTGRFMDKSSFTFLPGL